MRSCPSCNSNHTRYLGVEDDGGDYGDEICDQYECLSCLIIWDEDCIDINDIDDDEDES